MKTLINMTLLSLATIFMSMLNAQDTVKKKNGEVLKVVVINMIIFNIANKKII